MQHRLLHFYHDLAHAAGLSGGAAGAEDVVGEEHAAGPGPTSMCATSWDLIPSKALSMALGEQLDTVCAFREEKITVFFYYLLL